MGTFFLGPLEAHDIDEIMRALQAQLESIEDLIENGPMLTLDESQSIRAEQKRCVRLMEVCESLSLNS